VAESRRLLKAGKADEAEALLAEALKKESENRELRLAMLEASCLSGKWSRAAEQLPRVSPLSQSESASMFYAAVALYETGRPEEARVYLQRSLPNVSGPLVDEYSKKILGTR
jgi:predicted Zn-dependent protease